MPCSSEDGGRLFLCRPESIRHPALLKRYHDLLDETERARLARFRFEHDAHLFLVSHALVRSALSSVLPATAPGEWRFMNNAFGRPEIANGPNLRFNLSHCQGLAVCLIHQDECGADVEQIREGSDWPLIARDYFASREIASLSALESGQPMTERFFSFWTLKEAYIKARGMGLALPLDRFSFEIGEGRVVPRFEPEIQDDPGAWRFTLMRPSAEHFLATAVRPSGRRCAPQAKWFVPLVPAETITSIPIVAASI